MVLFSPSPNHELLRRSTTVDGSISDSTDIIHCCKEQKEQMNSPKNKALAFMQISPVKKSREIKQA